MNPFDDNLPAPGDERLDLLVDGELSEPDRRELLSSLDETPGAWRRCALAFLEAQSWKSEMRSIRRESAVEPSQRRSARRVGFFRGIYGTLFAVAACFMLALGLGLTIRGLQRPPEAVGPSPGDLAPGDLAEVMTEPAVSVSAPQEPELPAEAPGPVIPGDGWQLVSVPVLPGENGARSIQVPARAVDHVEGSWPEQFAPSIPPELLQALEQSGHEVRRSRHVVPFRMEDGRRLVVPCEEVELHFVGNSAYQ
jgi:hypothetical protein